MVARQPHAVASTFTVVPWPQSKQGKTQGGEKVFENARHTTTSSPATRYSLWWRMLRLVGDWMLPGWFHCCLDCCHVRAGAPADLPQLEYRFDPLFVRPMVGITTGSNSTQVFEASHFAGQPLVACCKDLCDYELRRRLLLLTLAHHHLWSQQQNTTPSLTVMSDE